jgi:hypothetical protein
MKRAAVLKTALLLTLTTQMIAPNSFAKTSADTTASNAAVLAEQKRLVTVDLLNYQYNETLNLTPKQVEALNQKAIGDLKSLKIERRLADRTPDISRRDAQEMIDSIEANPVTASYQYRKYSPEGREIGFCFGRAMYTHLLGLHLGVQKDAIKKAWVVGPMANGGINWAFHVTTLIRSGDEWLAIDNFPGKLLTIEEWLKEMQPMSTDHKLRLYITEPDKFVGPFRYSEVQMNHSLNYNKNLMLPRSKDWYSGFFTDLLNWFRSNPDMSTVGLPSPEKFRKEHQAK